MPTITTATITNDGVAAAVAANGLGLEVFITHVALGAGAYTPSNTATMLADLREVAPVLVGAKQGSSLTLTAHFLTSNYAGAAYGVGEIGFYIGDPLAGGILFAVISAPGRSSPLRGGANITNYNQTFTIALSGVPTGSVNVTFDPMAAAAMVALSAHLIAPNPHPQYAVDATPIGKLDYFLWNVAPPGYGILNGDFKNRAEYPEFYAHIVAMGIVVPEANRASGDRTLFSHGDGSTTFRMGDWRADSIRALDLGRGVDAGRTLASWQADMVRKHKHVMGWGEATTDSPFGHTSGAGHIGTNSVDVDNRFFNTNDGSEYEGAPGNNGVVGNENRVRTGAALLCVKML